MVLLGNFDLQTLQYIMAQMDDAQRAEAQAQGIFDGVQEPCVTCETCAAQDPDTYGPDHVPVWD